MQDEESSDEEDQEEDLNNDALKSVRYVFGLLDD